MAMSIKTLVSAAKLLPANVSVLIRGDHGIGKSQIVRQLAEHWGLDCIDRRISQMTEGDLIGLPVLNDGVTSWCPPDWFKSACLGPKVLFLDEINRGTPELEQACFQIILDRELNGHKLHPGTRVFSATNNGAAYKVSEMDPALNDRFFIVDLVPTVEEWLDWAKGPGKVADVITDFISQNHKWLDPAKKNADASQKDTSRRSWARFSEAVTVAELEPESEMFFLLATGFVGQNAAVAVHDFAKSQDRRVDPNDVLHSLHLKKGAPIVAKIQKMSQAELNALIEKVADLTVATCEKLTKAQGTSLSKFMELLPEELKIVLWTSVTKEGTKKVALALSFRDYVVKQILDIFGVLPGEAGVNMKPKIPAFLQPKA